MLYNIGKYIFWVYFHIFNRVKIYGQENIPKAGGLIICPNHIHWLDPILIGAYINRKINYMAKIELFSNKVSAAVLKGINVFPVKRGAPDIASIKNSLRLIKDGNVLGIFPEGTRSDDGKLKPAEPGVALIAVKTNSPIVPIRIMGSYRLFGKLKILVGKPIHFNEYQGKKLSGNEINQLSQFIMKEISKLS